jgi:hypothetical protein
MRRYRAPAWILLAGTATSLSALVWVPLLWGSGSLADYRPDAASSIFALAFQLLPFIWIGIARMFFGFSTAATALSVAACAAATVLTDYAVYEPSDTSSTAVIAFVVVPVEEWLGVCAILAADVATRAIARGARRRSRRRSGARTG